MKKILALIFFFSLFVIGLAPALADGGMYSYDPYSNRWDYVDENTQQAFINYDNGLQKMIIGADFEENCNKDVLWIFPVPADPQKVVIDVVTKYPELRGEELSGGVRSTMDDFFKVIYGTQIYPLPFLSRNYYATSGSGDYTGLGAGSAGLTKGGESDVVVYEEINKEGMTTEVVTAKTVGGLYDHIRSKGLKIDNGAMPAYGPYIGKDYTFIVSWINKEDCSMESVAVRLKKQRGLFVSFPADELYFPLVPTSIYGSRVVPATIRIIGHVTPKVFSDIKSYTSVNYFHDSYVNSNDSELKMFFGSNVKIGFNDRNVKYTRVDISAPSKMLTEDLWIKRNAPLKTYWQTFIIVHPVATTIIILIFNSCFVSLLFGLLLFKESRRGKGPIKFLLVGLANFLSIIGFIVFVMFLPTKKIKDEDVPLFEELKTRGYSSWLFRAKDYRKIIYIPAFSLSFILFSWLVFKLISL